MIKGPEGGGQGWQSPPPLEIIQIKNLVDFPENLSFATLNNHNNLGSA